MKQVLQKHYSEPSVFNIWRTYMYTYI